MPEARPWAKALYSAAAFLLDFFAMRFPGDLKSPQRHEDTSAGRPGQVQPEVADAKKRV